MTIVRHAEAYMDAMLGETITIADLCAETGCSIHALERAFRRIHGVSPRRFLTYRRLTGLRRLLLRHGPGDLSVTDAVLRCGLTHLGRAAVRYRLMFGEAPSATLRGQAVAGNRQVQAAGMPTASTK